MVAVVAVDVVLGSVGQGAHVHPLAGWKIERSLSADRLSETLVCDRIPVCGATHGVLFSAKISALSAINMCASSY